MIRPNELSKGNLLKYKGDIIEVIGFDKDDYVWFIDPHGVDSACVKIERCEPIELTEAWLKKFEFYYSYKLGGYAWHLSEGVQRFLVYKIESKKIYLSNVYLNLLKILKSVHSLQNIFFEFEEKKLTINDFK